MTDGVTATTMGIATEQQTPENTTAPFEPLPQTEVPKKSVGFTKEKREEKIRNGWIPPNLRPKVQSTTPTATGPAVDPQALEKTFLAMGWTPPAPQAIQDPVNVELLLEALVAKLVAVENNDQYRSIWLHFFQHGGVYNGPNYLQELQASCDYLNSQKVLK